MYSYKQSMKKEEKAVCIFPYINLSKSLIMDDFEILSYDDYDFSSELTKQEEANLDLYVDSFRKTFFQKWKTPTKVDGVGILKYKWTIIRTKDNSGDIDDKIKILYLLLKLHINHDFWNPRMNHIHFKTFDTFWCNVKGEHTSKFGSMWDYNSLHSTIPENIGWLSNIIIYPLHYCINDIDVSLKQIGNFEDILGVDKEKIDITYLYTWIIKDHDYYQKFLNLSSIHYWLEQQNDLFFYYAIIPTIIEVFLQVSPEDIKKQKAIDHWKALDQQILRNNENIVTTTYIKKKWIEVQEEIWLIARTFVTIYDLRNNLLHEGKKSFEKLKVEFKWHHLRIYDVFQLIFKFSILYDFIERWIIENKFIKVKFEWSIFTTWRIGMAVSEDTLHMDTQLDNLLNKAKNDKKYGS